MKVLHIIETLDLGGAEKVITDLINTMPHSVLSSICCLKHSGHMAKHLSREVPIFEMKSSWNHDFTLPIKLSRLIKKEQIDLVHAHNWNTFIESIIGSRILNTIPIVHTIHGPYFNYSESFIGQRKKQLRHVVEKILAKKSCKICAVSRPVQDYVTKHLKSSAEKVELVINGVETSLKSKNKKKIRHSFHVSDQDIVMCFVGRLASIKNLPFILSVFPQLKNHIPNLKFIIAGDGPQRNELETFVDKNSLNDSVTFVGYLQNTSDIYYGSDIFILPSKYEGISVALLEAMTAELPIIATDVGGNNQLVMHGKTGYLIPLNNKDKLIHAVIDLSINNDKRKTMGKNARLFACENFSLNKTIEKYHQIYQMCL